MTEGCQIPFDNRHQLPPRIEPSLLRWFFLSPTLELTLFFPIDMDTSVTPLPGDFVIIADGVPKPPLTAVWGALRELAITYDEPSLSPTTVRLQLPTAVQDFRDATLHQVFPFDLLGVEL